MKSILYLLIAGLLAGAGYLAYERFAVSGSSADENTLAQAQGTPPPPARLPTLPQEGEQPTEEPEVVEEIIEEPEVEESTEAPPPPPVPTPTATSYAPNPNAMPDVSEEEFCANYETHPRYNEFC